MSKNEKNHIADLKETFANLSSAGPKLNPEKCVFGVCREVLGYIIGPKVLRANLDKMKAIISMVEPSTKKRSPEAYGKNSNAKQVYLKVSRMQPPILQSLKWRVQGRMGPE
jgi:hypothetical protein